MHISFNYCFSYECRKSILKTHTHIYYMWLKEVRKFKGLRFILVSSPIQKKKKKIYFSEFTNIYFFMALVSIVVKAIKHE